MKDGDLPLPILKRIHNKYFPLINYLINETNANSLASILTQGVP